MRVGDGRGGKAFMSDGGMAFTCRPYGHTRLNAEALQINTDSHLILCPRLRLH